MRNSECGRWNEELGSGKSECGMRNGEGGIGNAEGERIGRRECKVEVGMRPPASPSCRLYEPEAVGAIEAYAPEGIRKLINDLNP